jgi:hypothetical protein
MSLHYKNPTERVYGLWLLITSLVSSNFSFGLVQSGHHYHLIKCHDIAVKLLTGVKQQSLTHPEKNMKGMYIIH